MFYIYIYVCVCHSCYTLTHKLEYKLTQYKFTPPLLSWTKFCHFHAINLVTTMRYIYIVYVQIIRNGQQWEQGTLIEYMGGKNNKELEADIGVDPNARAVV